MTDLNISILSAEDLIKYTRPNSPLEVALYDALAIAMRGHSQDFDDLQDELNAAKDSVSYFKRQVDKLEDEIESLKDTIFELKELNSQLAGEVQ